MARSPFAIALLAAILSLPARADFRVCNKTHALINLAVGDRRGRSLRTEGWWARRPGRAPHPIRGPLTDRFVYLYATTSTVWTLEGAATMCIDRGKFVAYGAENCWRRGLQAVTFAEIDTLDSRRLDDVPHRPAEVRITSPSSRPRSPPPAGRRADRLTKSRVARFRARSSR